MTTVCDNCSQVVPCECEHSGDEIPPPATIETYSSNGYLDHILKKNPRSESLSLDEQTTETVCDHCSQTEPCECEKNGGFGYDPWRELAASENDEYHSLCGSENSDEEIEPPTIETYASNGDLDQVKKITSQPIRTELLRNAMFCAAKFNHLDIIEYIRTTYLNTYADHEEIIRGACEGGHINILKHVFNLPNINKNDLVGVAIKCAADHGNKQIIEYLSSTFNAQQSFIDSCIQCVEKYGNFDLFKLFENYLDDQTRRDIFLNTSNKDIREYILNKFKDSPVSFFSHHYCCLLCKDSIRIQFRNYILTRCNHSFHRTCIMTFIQKNITKYPECPSCGTKLSDTIEQRLLEVQNGY